MLRIRGTSAIADDQQLLAVLQCRDDRFGDRVRGLKQSRVVRRMRKCGDRSFKMKRNQTF
jgi:hypothetical protein